MDYTVVTVDTYVLAEYVGAVLILLGVIWGIRKMMKLIT